MHGQAQIVNGIGSCTRITEGNIFQLQLVAFRFWYVFSVFKSEGLRVVQKLTNAGNIKAFLLQCTHLSKNTHDPLGKCGDRREVQQELGNTQAVIERHADQIYIGDAVASHGQHCLRNVCQHRHPFIPQAEIQIKIMNLIQ